MRPPPPSPTAKSFLVVIWLTRMTESGARSTHRRARGRLGCRALILEAVKPLLTGLRQPPRPRRPVSAALLLHRLRVSDQALRNLARARWAEGPLCVDVDARAADARRRRGRGASTQSCIESWVLPAPEGPPSSVVSQTERPPPRILSMDLQKVTMGRRLLYRVDARTP